MNEALVYSYLPNKRACTPYLILVQLPPCTILFGPARLLIFEHFSSLYEMKFQTFFQGCSLFENCSFHKSNMFESLIKIGISSEFIFDLFCLTICLLENKQKK